MQSQLEALRQEYIAKINEVKLGRRAIEVNGQEISKLSQKVVYALKGRITLLNSEIDLVEGIDGITPAEKKDFLAVIDSAVDEYFGRFNNAEKLAEDALKLGI